MSSQVPGTPTRTSNKRPRSDSCASDSSSGSDPSSPVPIFSAVRMPASNHSASSAPDLEEREASSISHTPTPNPAGKFARDNQAIVRPIYLARKGPFAAYNTERAGSKALWASQRISRQLSELRKRYPYDLIEEVVKTGQGDLHLKCNDCPDGVFAIEICNFLGIETHLKQHAHVVKVYNRVNAKGDKPAAVTALKTRLLNARDQVQSLGGSPPGYSVRKSKEMTNDQVEHDPHENDAYLLNVDSSLIPLVPISQVEPSSEAAKISRSIAASLDVLRKQYPDDKLDEVVDDERNLHIRCPVCPFRPFKPEYNDKLSNLGRHLLSVRHVENVYRGVDSMYDTPEVRLRIELLKKMAGKTLTYGEMSLLLDKQTRGISNKLAASASSATPNPGTQRPPASNSDVRRSIPPYSESSSRQESESRTVDKGKEPDMTREPSVSNVNLGASPLAAPEVDMVLPTTEDNLKVSLVETFFIRHHY